VLAGCAADAGEEPADAPAAEEDAPAEEAPDAAEPDAAVVGTVTVGGTTYSVTELRNCEPLEQEGIERELELQGLGQSDDGERVQIDVYVQEIGGAPFDDVSWNGPEGVNGAPADADVQLTDDRVTGTATLVESLTQAGALPIEFDLDVPGELIGCR